MKESKDQLTPQGLVRIQKAMEKALSGEYLKKNYERLGIAHTQSLEEFRKEFDKIME